MAQLYDLLTKLRLRVNDADELGSLVGYSVVHSLAHFSTRSNSDEEIVFEQVKAVYGGLQVALAGADGAAGHFEVLYECAQKVDPLLQRYIADTSAVNSRFLFKTVVEHFSHRRGNIEDNLRRLGMQLVDTVVNDGATKGNTKRVLTVDFVRLAGLFGKVCSSGDGAR